MKAGRVFALSLLVNLALAGWLAARLTGGLRDGAVAEERSAIAALPGAVTQPVLATSTAPAAVTVSYLTNRFDWRQVETNDLAQLAHRLRAVGCPEQTVCELVNARAWRALGQLEGRQSRLPFWSTGRQRELAGREAGRRDLAERERILASLEPALGRGAFLEDPDWKHDLVEQALLRFLTGPVSEAALSRLQQAMARAEAHQSLIRERADGILLDEEEAAVALAKQQFQTELRSVFSAAELEEFTARVGIVEFADEVCFEALDLSRAEIHQLGLLRGRYMIANLDGSLDAMQMETEQEEAVKDELRRWLGESRYARLERASDHDFRRLFELGKEHQLPRSAAESAYELRQLTAREVAALRKDTSLPETERQQRITDVQARTQEAMLKILGASACQQYLLNGGGWMTNVAGL